MFCKGLLGSSSTQLLVVYKTVVHKRNRISSAQASHFLAHVKRYDIDVALQTIHDSKATDLDG